MLTPTVFINRAFGLQKQTKRQKRRWWRWANVLQNYAEYYHFERTKEIWGSDIVRWGVVVEELQRRFGKINTGGYENPKEWNFGELRIDSLELLVMLYELGTKDNDKVVEFAVGDYLIPTYRREKIKYVVDKYKAGLITDEIIYQEINSCYMQYFIDSELIKAFKFFRKIGAHHYTKEYVLELYKKEVLPKRLL